MKLFVKKDTSCYHPVVYTLKLIEKKHGLFLQFVTEAADADLIWDEEHPDTQLISAPFYAELEKAKPDLTHEKWFPEKQVITHQGREDLLATIFYMVNCLQEYHSSAEALDNFGRYRYECSYQHRFGSMEENLAEHYIRAFIRQIGLTPKETPSSFFISHDIDTIYGSLLQDSFWAAKNLRIDILFSIILREITGKPLWKNIDQIIRLNSEYEIRSTFFWLVNKGKGTSTIQNADYNIARETKLLSLVEQNGFINGLHKSCSDMSIDDELLKLPVDSTFNRYHFLNFLPARDWEKISASKLTFDASLGFAEHYGFRNSYGAAFQPYDIRGKKVHDFVEAPLTFMDSTFAKYMKVETATIGDTIIGFYERHKTNCNLSLLWHNPLFTNYKYHSFPAEYKKVVSYIYENRISCVSPEELIQESLLQ